LAIDDYRQPALDDFSERLDADRGSNAEPTSLPRRDLETESENPTADAAFTLDAALSRAKSSHFDPNEIGTIILALLEREASLEEVAAFLGALAEAYRTTRDR
jgi:hypothetical protein